MLVWHWGLVVISALLSVSLVFFVVRYFALKREAQGSTPERAGGDASGVKNDLTMVSESEKQEWLALLKQQRLICTRLLTALPKQDFQGRSALSCWATFLDVETHIIEHSVPNDKALMLLGVFKSLLDRVDRAQEIDALLKSLKVNQSLLNELNKVIQKASDKVFDEVNITSELNDELAELQSALAKEAELDESLASLRAEMASMCEFLDRLKQHLEEVKAGGENASYVNVLEAFVEEAGESGFLDSVRSELDSKVTSLKELAAYQKTIIEGLKTQVHEAKAGNEGAGKNISAYDVLIVRLEKTLLESGRVVKRLESKLLSLQTIRYNLNIDAIKRDEALKKKKALLEQKKQSASPSMDIYGVIEEERNTMKNIEDLLYQDSFTEASDAYANEQVAKLASLRQMVNESELYVEMLERDLENAHVLHETLEYKLNHPDDVVAVSGSDLDLLASQDLEEVENLKEINDELNEERKRLEAEIYDGRDQSEEALKLQKKIDDLDNKIETVQKKYVEMEERYLTALMAKEDKE